MTPVLLLVVGLPLAVLAALRTVDHNSDKLPQRYTAITARYIALGENGSELGASVYGEVSVAGGTAQRYQRGRISSKRATGTWETVGPVHARYVAAGAEVGQLGFPVAAPAVVGGGRVQRFERGRISWSAATGARVTLGAIARRYAELGGEAGPLGFPVADERRDDATPGPWRRPGAASVRRSDFQGGSLVLDERTGVVQSVPRSG